MAGSFSARIFGRDESIFADSSSIFTGKLFFRRRFWAGNSFFWRRDLFSSSFLTGRLPFLATKPFLVVVLRCETPFFGDETLSRRRFEAGNSLFWRRDSFSSSFLGAKLLFLATRLFLVVVFGPETSFFSDETLSRHHFEAKIARF
ncbi:hypothetical protein NST61_04715 [Caldifermentibacillus hisashii]|uniref:hypothetical protein n=1 Tax=Caldifermentibacillus hisashii TaxID=996558 RepID=UPI0034D5966D